MRRLAKAAPSVTGPSYRHTPVLPLFNLKGNLIGYECEHCGLLLTPGGRPSEPLRARAPRFGKPGVIRFVENKSHTARLDAMKRRFWRHVKDRVVFWR